MHSGYTLQRTPARWKGKVPTTQGVEPLRRTLWEAGDPEVTVGDYRLRLAIPIGMSDLVYLGFKNLTDVDETTQLSLQRLAREFPDITQPFLRRTLKVGFLLLRSD